MIARSARNCIPGAAVQLGLDHFLRTPSGIASAARYRNRVRSVGSAYGLSDKYSTIVTVSDSYANSLTTLSCQLSNGRRRERSMDSSQRDRIAFAVFFRKLSFALTKISSVAWCVQIPLVRRGRATKN